jgi:hypothetical protein
MKSGLSKFGTRSVSKGSVGSRMSKKFAGLNKKRPLK